MRVRVRRARMRRAVARVVVRVRVVWRVDQLLDGIL